VNASAEFGRKVFLVHGRDDAARQAMETFLRALDLKVIPWRQAVTWAGRGTPYTGDIVKHGMANADAVVVLLTPDDEARLKPEFVRASDSAEASVRMGQPRMNVIFEAGMAMERDRSRVVLVEIGSMRHLTDLDGVNVIRMDDTVPRRRDLAHRLRDVGLAVDLENDEWLTAGAFAPTANAAHVSVESRPVSAGLPHVTATPRAPERPRSAKQDAYLKFWTLFVERVRQDRRCDWMRPRTPSHRSYLVVAPREGGEYTVSFGSGGRLCSQFYVDSSDPTRNRVRYLNLEMQKDRIASGFGGPLDWEPLPDKRGARVAAYEKGDVTQAARHGDYIEWFIDTATRLRAVIDPLLT
jgi:hypothetical protein